MLACSSFLFGQKLSQLLVLDDGLVEEGDTAKSWLIVCNRVHELRTFDGKFVSIRNSHTEISYREAMLVESWNVVVRVCLLA